MDSKLSLRARDKIHPGQQIEISAELGPKSNWEAQDISLDVIFADEDIIVVNKPAGLIVHPGAGAPIIL